MPNIPKRKLHEILFKLKNHPNIKDIYVEGNSDVNIIRSFFSANNIWDITIFPIETIEVASQIIATYNIENDLDIFVNNRGRVIGLVYFLQKEIVPKNQYLGVIDRDFDDLLGRNLENENLIYTDYTCFEMYYFNANDLNKLIISFFSDTETRPLPRIIDILSPILEKLFLIRYANYSLGLNLEYYDFIRFCSLNGDNINFDHEEYIRVYLRNNGHLDRFDSFIESIDENLIRLNGDHRHKSHGHDFITLLIWYFRTRFSNRREHTFNEYILSRTLLFGCDKSILYDEEFFKKLMTFYNS
jgi:hypothetical protein